MATYLFSLYNIRYQRKTPDSYRGFFVFNTYKRLQQEIV